MSELKSVVLLPYCPLPVNHGGKAEMWKALECLREMGPCTILSARTRPVGADWTPAALDTLKKQGFQVVFREDDESQRFRPGRAWGMAYAAGCKMLGLHRAFGHANPYHRLAFDPEWVARHSESADLAVFAYSYWAGFPTACPKAVLLLDLWSDFMWGGAEAETRDLKTANLVIVISKQEDVRLHARGIRHTLWSPPFVAATDLPDSDRIGMVGSDNAFNREGLRWLGSGLADASVKVFGGLARYAAGEGFESIGRYGDAMDPYRPCGIILMTTVEGMGVQIKSIEALAAGRAIVARRGAMRGIPPGNGAWIEVDTPAEMAEAARRLQREPVARHAQMAATREYYCAHLDVVKLRAELKNALRETAGGVQ
jgi:hypothetical protein